jgi:DNA polymerase III epsilon subunit-like protein
MVQGAVVARDGTELFNACVNPMKPVSKGALEVHGLSDEDLAVFEPFAAVWPQPHRALEGRRVVIYNRAFDTEIPVNDLARLPLDVWGATATFPDWPGLVLDEQWPHPILPIPPGASVPGGIGRMG